jgi:hypothetical protein
MGRGFEDVDTARGQIKDEHCVVPDQLRHVQTSVAKKSATAMTPQYAQRNICHEVAAAAPVVDPPPSGCADWPTGLRGAHVYARRHRVRICLP